MLIEMSFPWSLYWKSVVAQRVIRDSTSWILKGLSKEFLVFNHCEVGPGAQQVEERVPGAIGVP